MASFSRSDQAEQWMMKKIESFQSQNAEMEEKIKIQELQISQTASDLQDAIIKYSKCSKETCNYHLKEILNKQKDIIIKNHQEKINENIANIKSKFEEVKLMEQNIIQKESNFGHYLSSFDKLIQENMYFISNYLEKIKEIKTNSMQNRINSIIKIESNDPSKTFPEILRKLREKEIKKEKRINKLQEEVSILFEKKKIVDEKIKMLSQIIVEIEQKCSIAVKNEPLKYFQIENFVIDTVAPAYVSSINPHQNFRGSMPVGNLLILAPINSLTRQMQGASGISKFFFNK